MIKQKFIKIIIYWKYKIKFVYISEITGSDYDNLISVIHSFRDLKKL